MEQTNQLISTAEAAKFLGIKVSYLHKPMMRRVASYLTTNPTANCASLTKPNWRHG